MNKITREQIITEILDILTEIKLENLGLPKDIVEFIRSIPTEEVKNKLEPIQLENYIGWIGQILKSDSGIFAYYDIDSDQIQEAYKKIRKFVIYWPSKNIDFFPDDIFDNVVNEIFNILQTERLNLKSLLKLRKLVVSYANKFLPKYRVEVPEEKKQEIFSLVEELIGSFLAQITEQDIFSDLNYLISQDYRFFTSIFEKEDFSYLDEIKEKANIALEELEKEVQKLPVENMPEGYFWYDIGKSRCSVEAKRMGHCGSDDEGTLYSLRHKTENELISDSHITVSFDEEQGNILQIKGKGNSAPLQKYWPMIAELLLFLDAQVNLEIGKHAKNPQSFASMNKYLEDQTGVLSKMTESTNIAERNKAMKHSKLLNEIVIQETLRLLTEIKLGDLGFPQEVVNKIRQIPSIEVQETLKPQEFEYYLTWIGAMLKEKKLGYDMPSVVAEETGNFLIIGLQDLKDAINEDERFKNIPNVPFEKVEEIVNTLAASLGYGQRAIRISELVLMDYLNARKASLSFFDKFLVKKNLPLPEIRDKIINSLDNVIESILNYAASTSVGFFRSLDEILVNRKDGFQFFKNEIEPQMEEERDANTGEVREIEADIYNLSSLEQFIDKKVKKYINQIENPEQILNVPGLPAGYFWYDIGLSYCEIESDRMGHCGNDSQGTLYSLRRSRGEGAITTSHVTISYNEPTKTVFQIKGGGNIVPKKQYWPMVAAFFKHFNVKASREVGSYSSSDFSAMNSYLTDNTDAQITTALEQKIIIPLRAISESVQRRIDSDLPDEFSTGAVGVESGADSAIIKMVLMYPFYVSPHSLGHLKPSMLDTEMTTLANEIISEYFDDFVRDYNRELWRQAAIETNVAYAGKKSDKNGKFKYLITSEISFNFTEDSAGDEDITNNINDIEDIYKSMIRESDTVKKFNIFVDALYEPADYDDIHPMLVKQEEYATTVGELFSVMEKNPHAKVQKLGTGNKVLAHLVQTRADDYAYRFDFDEYMSTPYTTSSETRARTLVGEVVENIQKDIENLLQKYFKSASDSIDLQMDMYNSFVSPFNEEALISNSDWKTEYSVDNGMPVFKLKLAFVIQNNTTVKEITEITSALQFLSENYGDFVEYLDEHINNKLQKAISTIAAGTKREYGSDPIYSISRMI